MSGKRLVIGVDGGGTKTAVVCVDASTKQVLSRWKGGCTNFNSVGDEQARNTLTDGIKDVVKQIKSDDGKNEATLGDVVAVSLGMSGVDRPNDKIKLTGWLTELFGREDVKLSIQNDAVAALCSGTNGVLNGNLVVISGTGMICCGYDPSGKERRSGGWGPLLGDEGSGHAIGTEILRAVVSATDGRGPATSLSEAVLAQLNFTESTQLIPWAYSDRNPSWEKFANLAPLAAQCIRKDNDKVATRILEHSADELVKNIRAVVEGLNMSSLNFTLVLAGGNLTHESSILADLLSKRLNEVYPQIKISKPSTDPEVAVALLAINKFNL